MHQLYCFLKRVKRSERRTGNSRQSSPGLSLYHRRLTCEPLEDRRLLSVTLNWTPKNALSLTESTSGTTPTITISEPSPTVNQLKIDLGSGKFFASGSTTSAAGLTYQNAGSPTTSQYATIDISPANNVSSLTASLLGDSLMLGPVRDSNGGLGSITASAGTIEAAEINTFITNGSVSLRATGNLTVDSGATIQVGTGTIELSADLNADGTGDDGVGTLSIGAGAMVTTTVAAMSTNGITLRGADIEIDTSANPAVVGGQLGAAPSATLTGLSTPKALAFDSSGNLYVANDGNNTVSKFAPGAPRPAPPSPG